MFWKSAFEKKPLCSPKRVICFFFILLYWRTIQNMTTTNPDLNFKAFVYLNYMIVEPYAVICTVNAWCCMDSRCVSWPRQTGEQLKNFDKRIISLYYIKKKQTGCKWLFLENLNYRTNNLRFVVHNDEFKGKYV